MGRRRACGVGRTTKRRDTDRRRRTDLRRRVPSAKVQDRDRVARRQLRRHLHQRCRHRADVGGRHQRRIDRVRGARRRRNGHEPQSPGRHVPSAGAAGCVGVPTRGGGCRRGDRDNPARPRQPRRPGARTTEVPPRGSRCCMAPRPDRRTNRTDPRAAGRTPGVGSSRTPRLARHRRDQCPRRPRSVREGGGWVAARPPTPDRRLGCPRAARHILAKTCCCSG